MGRLFGETTEYAGEDFRVVKTEENVRTEEGYPQVLKKYVFSMVSAASPATTVPTPLSSTANPPSAAPAASPIPPSPPTPFPRTP